MRLILTCLMLLGLLTQAAHSKPNTLLTLNKRNTVVFRGVVNAKSVALMQVEIMAMSARLKAGEIIYMVLDTPGGSVTAGNELIDFIHGLAPRRVKTVSLFAASMGFHIAQNLDERLVLPSSTLMSHRASLSGISGELPGELMTRLHFILNDLDRMDGIVAERMGITRKKYQRMIRDELWLNGDDAVKQKAADRVILARCDSSFSGTSEIELGEFMGITFMGKMSNCPLITGLLDVRMVGTESKDVTDEAQRMCDSYTTNKTDFVKRYISTGKLVFPQK